MTMGDHVYRKDEIFQVFDRTGDVLRPANYPAGFARPGTGAGPGPRRHHGRGLHRAGPNVHEAGRLPVPCLRPDARPDRRRRAGRDRRHPRRGDQRKTAPRPLPRRPGLGHARHAHSRRHGRRTDPEARHRLSDRRRHDRPSRLDPGPALRSRLVGHADLRAGPFRRRHRRPATQWGPRHGRSPRPVARCRSAASTSIRKIPSGCSPIRFRKNATCDQIRQPRQSRGRGARAA